jgi:hypothetical protein
MVKYPFQKYGYDPCLKPHGAGISRKSPAEQVAKIARIVQELIIDPATPDGAMKILGLRGQDKINF